MPHSFCGVGSGLTLFSNVPKVPKFDVSILNLIVVMTYFCIFTQFVFVHQANSCDPAQTWRFVASDQGLHRLHMSADCLWTELF